MNLLIIDQWSAYCSNCGDPANPRDMIHDCGAEFEAITTSVTDEDIRENIQLLRPDLPIVEVM